MPWWWKDIYEIVSVTYMLIMIFHYMNVYHEKWKGKKGKGE